MSFKINTSGEKPHEAIPSHPQITTTVLQNAPPNPNTPPNGGLKAWLHVLGAFFLFFNTWGLLNAFGVYQTYYEETPSLFPSSSSSSPPSSSQISWIGSLEAFMLLLVGVFAGPVYDRGYLRSLLLLGSCLVVVGHMLLSVCGTYWQVLLAQGVVVGIGTGCLFVPCVAVLPQWFSSRLGAAMGLAAAGSALGGVVYPIVLFRLFSTVGFAWATRIVGFIALATLSIPLCILRLRVRPRTVRAVVDVSAFRDLFYVAFVGATLVTYMGLFVIFFYLSYYADATHIVDTSLSFYLVPIFNAASMFGRTIPNILADKIGPFNILAPATLVSGLLMLCMMAVRSEAVVLVVAVLSGFVSGALIGLPPLCFVALTGDKSKLGTRMGMGYAIVGLGVLASGPSGGAILGGGKKLDWDGLWMFGGILTCVGGLGFAVIRIVRYGCGFRVKA